MSQPDVCLYGSSYFETISLVDALSIVTGVLARDPEFCVLGIEQRAVNSFFTMCFLHILPQRYHNLQHSVNTLCFGSLILDTLERGHRTDVWDRMCFTMALCLHDIGHPGERSRERIRGLSHVYGATEPLTFEMVHVAIFHKIAMRHRSTVFRGLDEASVEKRLRFVEEMIFATDLKLNKEIADEFDSKYFDCVSEDGKMRKRLRKGVEPEIGGIEYKMAVKLSDLSACYKDYSIFNTNSIAFWSEVHDRDGDTREVGDILGDIYLLENISIPLAESFSLVFSDFRHLYTQALVNLERHRGYLETLRPGVPDKQ